MLPKLTGRFAYLNHASLTPWMQFAIGEIGQREVAGAGSNPRIIAYREEAGTPFGGDDGVVPWCAIWINAMLRRSGLQPSGNAMARGFLPNPHFTKLQRAMLGAIAIKASPSRGKAAGHVGFYVGEDASHFYLLGGNQNDEVNISGFRRSEFLGFVWPKGAALPPAPWDRPYPINGGPAKQAVVSDA